MYAFLRETMSHKTAQKPQRTTVVFPGFRKNFVGFTVNLVFEFVRMEKINYRSRHSR